MPSKLLQLTPKLAVDMGQAKTRCYVDGSGIVVTEASCLAIDTRTGAVLAVGTQAAELSGRLGKSVTVEWLLQDSTIRDCSLMKQYLQYVLAQALPFRFFSPDVLISLPTDTPESIESIVTKAWYELGMHEVSVVSGPLAAAIGAGVPIADVSGSLVASLGAGVMEIAAIALGSQVAGRSSYKAGDYLDQLIQATIKQQQHMILSRETARSLKESVAHVQKRTRGKTVTGKNVLSGAPQEIVVKSVMLHESVLFVAQEIVELAKQVLRDVEPAIAADIVQKGLLLTGGLAQLAGLDEYLAERLGIPVAVVEAPTEATIRGLGMLAHEYTAFKQSLAFQKRE